MPDAADLINYYTPTTVDDSGEIKYIQYITKYSKITTKLNRRNQFKSMLRTNEVVSLEKYPRKVNEEKEDDCDVEKEYTIHEIRNSCTSMQLRDEFKSHGKKVSGRKIDLQKRLIKHYEFHDS